MNLTLILVILVAIGASGVLLKTRISGERAGAARVEAKYQEAQKKADELARKIEEEGANHLADMETAFKAGEAKATERLRKAKAKGTTDVTQYAVFNNRECVLPAQSLQTLNTARKGMEVTDDDSTILRALGLRTDGVRNGVRKDNVPASSGTGTSDATVRKPEDAGERRPDGTVPTGDRGYRSLGTLH